MVNTKGSEPEKIPGLRKAAILMVMLGDEASSIILRNLDEDEVQEISREIARVGSLTAEEAEDVLEEFYQMAVAHDYVVKGGIDYANKILISAFGPETAKKMLDRLMKTLGNETLSFDALQKTDPQTAGQVHSQRASANHRADSFAPQSLAGRRPVVFASRRNALRCRPAHGQPGSDLAGNYLQNRESDRIETEIPGRD